MHTGVLTVLVRNVFCFIECLRRMREAPHEPGTVCMSLILAALMRWRQEDHNTPSCPWQHNSRPAWIMWDLVTRRRKKLGVVAPAFNGSSQRQREVNLCDLKFILAYVEHSRTAVLRYCLNKTTSNNNNTEYLLNQSWWHTSIIPASRRARSFRPARATFI